ncbi:MAG: protein kinase [Opitutaceae bacterium]
MSTPLDREEELFSRAAAMPAGERPAFLRKACGDDQAMYERLGALLSWHDSQGDVLDESVGLAVAPALEFDPAAFASEDLIDRELGRYRLVERLGEGGVGVVYRAEQREPIHRMVALKVVKPGMDTREVIQRFESERQALALMEHPGIARVIDAGATPEGRPYFVMELVGGREITRYCDEERLTLARRLQLFTKVCDAVQHAHQKGVIHRDLKPSNVLVAPDDQGDPQPKIIDFGIAKALAEGAGWEKHVTQVAQLIGTPAYMSPEQAAGVPGLDTRSDVYSLGVILYELLAGRLPYDDRRLRQGGVDELRRRIREEEAPRPSVAVQNLPDGAAVEIAAARHTTSPRLVSELKGELDWVVLRCLEKTPAQRYATAHDLAEDIRRYLENEPVRAVAPSRLYRLGKSIRRNRAVYAAGLIVLLTLLTATSVSLLQATRARRAEAVARQRAAAEAAARAEAEEAGRRAELAAAISAGLSDFLRNDLLAQASPDQQPDRNVTLRTVVDRAAARLEGRFVDQPLIRTAVQETLADTYRALGDYAAMHEQAQRVYETRRELLGPDHLDTLRAAVMLYDSLPIPEKISPQESLGADTLERLTRTVGADHPLTLELRSFYHKIQYRGRYREAEPLLRAVKDDALRVLGSRDPVTLTAMSDYAIVLAELERYAEAAEVARQTIDFKDKVYGVDHPQTMPTMTTLAVILSKLDRHDEARELAEHVLAVRRRVLGAEHPQTLITAVILGGVYVNAHMIPEAAALLPPLQEDLARVIGPEHPGTLNVGLLRATLAVDAGNLDEAELLIAPVREALNRRFGPGYTDSLEATRLRARIAAERGQWARAADLLAPALDAAREAVGATANITQAVQRELTEAVTKSVASDENGDPIR